MYSPCDFQQKQNLHISRTRDMEVTDKAPSVITRPSATALFCIDSGDRFRPENYSFSGTAQQRQVQYQNLQRQNIANQYNDFSIQKNQNLIQGGFTRIGVTEVRMPWVIPNINPRNNKVWAQFNNSTLTSSITIPTNFYTGPELALEVADKLNSLSSISGTSSIEVSYQPIGTFQIYDLDVNTALTLYPSDPSNITPQTAFQNSLLTPMGMRPNDFVASSGNINSNAGQPIEGWVAPLTYTDYIDVVSYQLTTKQRAKDMTTQSDIPRSAIISRLYLNNENSTDKYGYITTLSNLYIPGEAEQSTFQTSVTTNPPGTEPFLLYRQYQTPKMIRWENDSSIGTVDIALYDMYGAPLYQPTFKYAPAYTSSISTLYTAPAPLPDFQITFLCSED